MLSAAPAEVRLRFNEPVLRIAARVVDRDGRDLARSSEVLDRTLRIRLPAGLPEGSYLVSYRVVSADSHPVAGSLRFALGQGSGRIAARPAVAGDRVRETVSLLNRALYLVAALIATGATLFMLLVDRGSSIAHALHRLIRAAALAGSALAINGIWLQGADLAGTGLASAALLQTWELAMHSSRGQALAGSAAALLALVAALPATGALRASIAWFGVLAMAGSFVLSGHGAIASPRWLAFPAWCAHVLLAGFWIGSLACLLVALRAHARESPGLLQRFSRRALPAVGVLLAAGATMALIQLRQVSALVDSAYGRILCAKLALAAGMLALAAYHRLRLAPRFAAGGKAAARALRRSVRIELALGIALLAVTAVLSRQEPPRPVDAPLPETRPWTTRATSGTFTAELSVAPARTGRNRIAVRLFREGEPWKPLEITAELSHAGAGVEPLTRRMHLGPDGAYLLEEELPLAGIWSVRLSALITEFSRQAFVAEVPVREGLRAGSATHDHSP